MSNRRNYRGWNLIIKFLFFYSIILFSKTSFSSVPILTASNCTPVIGDVVTRYQADTTVQEGAAGANVTWNFNSISISSNTTVASYFAAASTPYSASFPSANIALEENSDYAYINSSASGLQNLGYGSSGDVIVYLPPSYNQNSNKIRF